MHLSSHSTDGRKGGRQRQYRKKIHSFEFTVTLLEKQRERDGNKCVHAHTCMNALSVEPNVRPIKVYWDQVVLVSLKVEADSFNQTWG